MRCKEGDFVVVIKSMAGNEGCFGTVQRHIDNAGDFEYPSGRTNYYPGWLVIGGPFNTYDREEDLYLLADKHIACFPDDWLQPIRPPGLSKETETQKDKELENEM